MFGDLGTELTRWLTPRVLQESDLSDLLAPNDPEIGVHSLDLAGSVVRMLGALGLVLALLIVTLWLLRRFGGRWVGVPTQGGDGLEVLLQRPLGGRRELTVVRWEGRRLLLGVTPESITTLASEAEPGGHEDAFEAAIDEALAAEPAAKSLIGAGLQR